MGEEGRNLLGPDIPAGANEEGGVLAILEDLGVDVAVEVDTKDEGGGINSIKGGGRLNNFMSQRADELIVGGVERRLLEDDLDFVLAEFL